MKTYDVYYLFGGELFCKIIENCEDVNDAENKFSEMDIPCDEIIDVQPSDRYD